MPQFTPRLSIEVKTPQSIVFTVRELQAILWCAGEDLAMSRSGELRALRKIVADFPRIIRDAHGIGAIPASQRLYQFKITLTDIQPMIWRRFQVKDCTLDKLHQHIQTAMGWKNSHLHRFEILGIVHGDPELVCGNPECFIGVNSLETKISEIVPQTGTRFRFLYVYDYGDCWEHDVLFEGCLPMAPGIRYPVCLEGARACPPEDAGGVAGYTRLLKAIADPADEEHCELVEWVGPGFDPEKLDTSQTSRRMQQGLPNWRRMSGQPV